MNIEFSPQPPLRRRVPGDAQLGGEERQVELLQLERAAASRRAAQYEADPPRGALRLRRDEARRGLGSSACAPLATMTARSPRRARSPCATAKS